MSTIHGMESAPMKASELGKYVCVADGGCLHTPHRTITADGVFVKKPDSLNPGGYVYTSAHRDCFEAWVKRVGQRLEYLRGELRAERISWGELHELQGLAPYIDAGDNELLEAAGAPEHTD